MAFNRTCNNTYNIPTHELPPSSPKQSIRYKCPEVDISRNSACKVFAWVWLVFRITITILSAVTLFYLIKSIQKDKDARKNPDYLNYEPKKYKIQGI